MAGHLTRLAEFRALLFPRLRRKTRTGARGYALRELIDSGLPQDAEFIREYFFMPRKRAGVPSVRASISRGLGARPPNKEKHSLLVELLLDPRVEAEWLRPLNSMGDETFQTDAAQSINAHAGKELITQREVQDLREPDSAKRVFPGIVEKLRALREARE